MSFQQKRFNDALWRSTETVFRGVMDLSQSRSYVLAMLILKAISAAPLNIVVPDEARFETLHASREEANLDQRLNDAFRLLMEANPNKLAGVFANVNFAASQLGSAAQRQTRLVALLDAFNAEALDLRNLPHVANVIGNAYEFLIDQYATMSRSVGGEFYTPAEVSTVMARLLDLKPGETVYDPTCGAGTLLLQCAKVAPGAQVYGQELNQQSYGLALLNMILHGIEADQTHIKNGDTLRDPQLLIDETHVMQFDAIVANPPYSLSNWGADELADDKFNRFQWGYPPAKTGDLAFISHMLSSLKEGGRMAVVMPNGILFRGGVEGKIRDRFLKENLIEAIIALPANLFYGTSIPTVMILFKKGRASDTILFIDASNHFESGGSKEPNRLRYSDQQRIFDAFTSPDDVPHYSARVKVSDILENDQGNLNIGRHVDTYVMPETQDLRGHHEGWMPRKEIEEARPIWEKYGFDPYETLFIPRQEEDYLDFNPELKQDQLSDLLKTEDMKAKEALWHDAVIAWWFSIHEQIIADRPMTRESLTDSAEAAFLPFGIADRYRLIDAIDKIWSNLGQHIEQAGQAGAVSVIREYLDALRANDQTRLPLYRADMIEALFPDLKTAQEVLQEEQQSLNNQKEALEESAIEMMAEDDEEGDEDEDEDKPRKKPANRGIKALEARLKELKAALKKIKPSPLLSALSQDEPSVEVGRVYTDKVGRWYLIHELISAPNMQATTWENLMVKAYEVDDHTNIRSSSLLSIRARELTLDKTQPYKSVEQQIIEVEIAEIEETLTPYKEVQAKLSDVKKQISAFDARVAQEIEALADSLEAQAGLILCQVWQAIFIEPVKGLWSEKQRRVLSLIQNWWKKYRVSVRETFRRADEASRHLDDMMGKVFSWWTPRTPEPPAPKKHKRQYRWSRFPRICFIDRLVDTAKSPEPQMVEAYYFEPRPEPKKKGKKEEGKERQKVLF